MGRNIRIRLTATGAVLMSLVLAAAGPADNSLNARFVDWPEKSNVIHILPMPDEGREGYGPALVKEGQWILFGFEWTGDTLEELNEFVARPEHDVELSVDGGATFSVKSGYQEAIIAEPGHGPRWSWDHDGDGIGDGNGNGVDDWEGPILFFRYQVDGLEVGTHTFVFDVIDPEHAIRDTITIEVVGGE